MRSIILWERAIYLDPTSSENLRASPPCPQPFGSLHPWFGSELTTRLEWYSMSSCGSALGHCLKMSVVEKNVEIVKRQEPDLSRPGNASGTLIYVGDVVGS